MLKIILEWLDNKYNYVNYKPKVDDVYTYLNRLSNMLNEGRIHFQNLEASDCYIIQNISENINYSCEHPTHYRYNFSNYNVKRNEYILNKVMMCEVAKNFTTDNSIQNRANVGNLLRELQHEHISKNKFLEKFDQYSYKEIFLNFKENFIAQEKNIIETQLLNNEFSFEDFKSDNVDKIKEKSHGLQEIGIFYPFVFDHNIFQYAHFLFEINHLKFQKNDKNFLDNVKKFYKEYGMNSDKSKGILKLEKYFTHPGLNYSKYFAYFDPFKNYEKYITQYEKIRKIFESKKLEFKDFLFELFDAFNRAQIEIVIFQHENLIDALITTKRGVRRYSVRELIELQIKKIENNELQIQGLDKQMYCAILHAFKNLPRSFSFKKNTKVDDMECFLHFPDFFKQNAQFILDDLLYALGKDDSSKLQYIFDHCKNELNVIIKKYKLNLECKHVIHDMLLDLVLFYNDKNEEKLSRPFNSTIEKIYQKNKNKDIEKIIDFDFPRKFMEQYNDYFNVYKPCEIQTENGKTKYMMMM